jgi:hypothetical protein
MPLWIDIVAVAIAYFVVALSLGVAFGRAAKRGDERLDGVTELSDIAIRLRPLGRERSPSGTAFFPTRGARRELAENVHEALRLDIAAGP